MGFGSQFSKSGMRIELGVGGFFVSLAQPSLWRVNQSQARISFDHD